MQKTKKRFLSALLACVMLVSLFPFTAFADDNGTTSDYQVDKQEVLLSNQVDYEAWAYDETALNPVTTEDGVTSYKASGASVERLFVNFDPQATEWEGDVVIAAEFYVDNITTGQGFTLSSGDGNGEFMIHVNGFQATFSNGTADWKNVGKDGRTVAAINTNGWNKVEWHFTLAENDNVQCTAYVNGTELGTCTAKNSGQLPRNGFYFMMDGGQYSSYKDKTIKFRNIEKYAEKETCYISNTAGLVSAIENQKDGQTWVLAPGQYDVTITSESTGKYGSGMIITADNITIKAADPGDKPVLYGFSNEFNSGVDDSDKNGQDTIYISGKNVTLENLKIMPLGGIGAGANNWQKTVEVVAGATGFTMTGCETLPNDKSENSMKKAAGNIHVSINDAKITGNSFGTGTTISAGWVNEESAANTYTVDVSDNYWGENVTAADIAGKIDGNVKVDTYYTDAAMTETSTIGGTPVATADQLQAAVTSAKNGDTIILYSDIVLDGQDKKDTEGLLTIEGKTITLDGNGHTISAKNVSDTPSMINIQDNANVTVKNLTIDGKVDTATATKHGLNVYAATATVENVTIKNGTGYAIVANGSTVKVDSLTTENNKWGGINVEGKAGNAALTVDNANITEDNSILFEQTQPETGTAGSVAATINNGQFKYIKTAANVKPDMVINGGTFATGTSAGAVNIKDYVASGMEYNPSTGKVVEIYTGNYSYEINVANMDNGSVSVDKYATEGEKVTITVSPDKAYKLDELTVTANGKDVELTDNGDGTYTFTMPGSKVQISATFVEDENYEEPTPEEPSSDMPFGDVNTGDWFYDVVKYAYDNGLMTGTSATTFEPNTTTTRGMIVAILNRLEGNPTAADAGFADVNSGDWYADAVNWAAGVGIVNGYSDTQFGPNDPITREQMAAILYNYAEYKGYDVSARADISSYDDAANVSDWAIESVQWANAMGLVNGMTDTTIEPQGNATRAQIAAILSRYLTGING